MASEMNAVTSAFWEVQIEGRSSDLEHLARNFQSAELTITKDVRDNCYMLRSVQFVFCSSSADVLAVAEKLVGPLSGVLNFARESDIPLRCGAAYRRHTDGRSDVFVHVKEALQLRVETADALAIVRDSSGTVVIRSPPPRTLTLSKLSITDASVAKALRLLSSDGKSWVGIYRILEVIEHDVGGEGQLAALGWGGPGQLKRCKRTSNSAKAVGDGARHGSDKGQPPPNPMTLDEAGVFLNKVLDAWFAAKGA